MITNIQANVDQVAPSVLSEGSQSYPAISKVGQLFTAGWKQRLLLAGKVWRVSVGTVAAGADPTQITGGGAKAGAIMELELPEIAIGVGLGYYLIPLEIHVSVQADLDADADSVGILALMDRSLTGVPVPTAATVETPTNMLDGAAVFPGVAYSAVNTTDILDPIMDELLCYEQAVASVVDATGTIVFHHTMHYEPTMPSFAAGPCGLFVYWYGSADAAATGMATVVVAAIPSSWVPTS